VTAASTLVDGYTCAQDCMVRFWQALAALGDIAIFVAVCSGKTAFSSALYNLSRFRVHEGVRHL
jgi:hypothetical protein